MDVVDPTGAGDAYAGGLLGYIAQEGKLSEPTLRRAMGWASVVGSFYVEGFGPAGLRDKSPRDLERRYKDFAKMCLIP
jgi:sugar/nucleoside kinase (ribokinase family)